MPDYAALDKLGRALNPLPSAAVDGAHQLSVAGTVNIIGGGSGGTSMTDNNPFTPGSTSITPMGGYFGGRQIGSGNAAAPALSGSAILQVHVVAGGAGGGLAQMQVVGSDNQNFANVGYPSGGTFRNAVPIFGQGGSLPIVGSVNVVQGTLPLPVVGSMGVTPLASFTVNLGSIATVNLGLGTVNIGNNPTVVVGSIGAGSMNVLAGQAGAPWSVTGSVWIGGIGADTANSALRVNVVAGGAGGGVANLEVQGTANQAIHVGFASGAGPFADGGAAVPVVGTVNIVGGGSGFASVAVYGSPANPVYNVGSVNITNFGDTTNSAFRVNVVAGGAGGGVANITVRGTANTDLHVGTASGANLNQDGGAAMPVVGTVNIVGGGGFATAAVYGSPAFPVYNIGSVNVVNNVGVFGSLGALTGSVNITGSINPVGVFGSVNVLGTTTLGAVATVNLGLGTVNIGNAPNVLASLAGIAVAASGALDVDPRGNLVATQWIISFGGSGQSAGIAGSIASQRVYFSSYHLVATATVDAQWMSPSGVAITGSFRLLPGAGFALAGQMPAGPVLMGSLGSQVFLAGNVVGNIGGVAVGWIGS